jgi:anaerobic selenocysteine-containing dehydrogenase
VTTTEPARTERQATEHQTTEHQTTGRQTTRVLGTCHHDCPDSCGWEVTVQDGVAVKLRGNPEHPFSQGELCPKVTKFLDRVYSPDRVLYPMRRVGPKGTGQFERISWDSALTEIAARVTHDVAAHGGQAIYPWNDAGTQGLLHMSSLDRRLFAKLGSSRMTGSVCGMTSRYGAASTNGNGKGIDPMDLRFSKLIILWGTNTKLTNRHLWPTIEAARSNGAYGNGRGGRLVRATVTRHGRGDGARHDARNHS